MSTTNQKIRKELPVGYRKDLCHMTHIRPIGLRFHRGEEYLTTSKFYYKEDCTSDRLTPYQKLNSKEVTGGQHASGTKIHISDHFTCQGHKNNCCQSTTWSILPNFCGITISCRNYSTCRPYQWRDMHFCNLPQTTNYETQHIIRIINHYYNCSDQHYAALRE